MAEEPRLAVESIAGQRPYQEDSVIAQNLSDGRLLIAVADGMGGHAAGEVASALALETLVSALEGGDALDAAFVRANEEVHEQARDPSRQGMGTTLVAAVIEDGEYFVGNVGDSRGYLVQGEGIRQLTDDHSFVAEAIKRGQSEEEAMRSPFRDALTRSIGTEPQVAVDVFGPFPIRDDSALLLCSDGLYKTLTDDDLLRIYLQSGSPQGAAQTLVSEAFDSGSDDNISVVVAEYGSVPRVAQGTMPIEFEPGDGGPDPDPDATAPMEAVSAAATLVDMPPLEGGPPASEETVVEQAIPTPAQALSSDVESSGPPPGLIAAVAVVVVALLAWVLL